MAKIMNADIHLLAGRPGRAGARALVLPGGASRVAIAGASGVATAAVLAACVSPGSPAVRFPAVPSSSQWRAAESVRLLAAQQPAQTGTPPGPAPPGSSSGSGPGRSPGSLSTAENDLGSAWNTLQGTVSSAWDHLPNGMGFGVSYTNYADGNLQIWLGKDANGDSTLSFGGGPGIGPGRGRLTPAYEAQPGDGFQADAGFNTRNGAPNAYVTGGIGSDGPHVEVKPGHSPVGRLPVTWGGSGPHGGINGPSLSGRSTTPQWWPFAWGSGTTSINLRTGAVSGGGAGVIGVGGFFAWKAIKDGLKSLMQREAPWRPTPSPPQWQDPWGPAPEPQPGSPGGEIPNNPSVDPYVNNEYGTTANEPATQGAPPEGPTTPGSPGEPPTQEPPAVEPPTQEPPAGEPPTQGPPSYEPPTGEAPYNPNVDPLIDTPDGTQNPDTPTGTYEPPGAPQPPAQTQPPADPSPTGGQPPPDPWYSPGNLAGDTENAWNAVSGAAGDAQSALQSANDWLAQNDGWAWMQQQPFTQELGKYGLGPDVNAPGGKFGPNPESPGGAPDAPPDIPFVPEAYSAPLNSSGSGNGGPASPSGNGGSGGSPGVTAANAAGDLLTGGLTSLAGGYVTSTPTAAPAGVATSTSSGSSSGVTSTPQAASGGTVTALGAGSGSGGGGSLNG